jgi:hypothetical protein
LCYTPASIVNQGTSSDYIGTYFIELQASVETVSATWAAVRLHQGEDDV